jgi:hypothetical protein
MTSPRLLVALSLAALATAQDKLEVPLSDQHPALQDLSSWLQKVEHRGGPVDKGQRGVFPVGDGDVFGYFGLADRACTVQALSGPTYQTDESWAPLGHFGEQTFLLRLKGQDLALPRQTVARVRGANLVVTEDRSDDGLTLTTLNFAVPGQTTLFRIVDVRNGTGKPIDGLELVALPQGPVAAAGNALRKDYASNTRPYSALFAFAGEARADKDQLVKPLGTVAKDEIARCAFVVRTFRRDGTTPDVSKESAEAIEQLVPRCLQWWKERLTRTATVSTNHRKVADLLEDWKVLMLTQRSAASGLVGPMINHRTFRVRDAAGPMLAFLRYNLWDDAKAQLQAIYRAASRAKALPETLPLDLKLTDADEVDVRWEDVRVPESELGSWVILMHDWYWRATGDIALLRKHFPMLQRCLLGQGFTRDGLQSFQGQEDYLGGILHGLLPARLNESAALIAHDAAAGRQSLSFDCGVLHLVANYAMGELHEAVDKAQNPGKYQKGQKDNPIKRQYTVQTFQIASNNEKHFWQAAEKRFAPALSPIGLKPHTAPLANINLRLQWAGWTFATGEKNKENVRSTLQTLWRAPSAVRVGLTPGTGYTTGHTQGYLLYALADLDDRSRLDCLEELLRMAGPAGEWGELHDPEGRPTWTRDQNWPDRCQPWMSGVNVDAIFFALNGIRYATVPAWDTGDDARFRMRIPRGATYLNFKNVAHDNRRLNIFMEERREKMSPREAEEQEEKIKKGELKPTDRKDPNQIQHRIAFRIDMENPPSDADHITCAINVGRTVFVRYLMQSLPSVNESWDYPVDEQAFYPLPGDKVELTWQPRPVEAPAEGYQTLLFAARPGAERSMAALKPLVVDVGLPLDPGQIAGLLMDGGKRRCERVVFDIGARQAGSLTAKSDGFWKTPALAAALDAFRAAGGAVIEPVFLQSFKVAGPFPCPDDKALDTPQPPEADTNWPGQPGSTVAWRDAESQPGGYLDLRAAIPHPGSAILYAAVQVEVAEDREVLVRAGSDEGMRLSCNGSAAIDHRMTRPAFPDQAEALVQLKKGSNRILVKLLDTGGSSGIYLRVLEKDGQPANGIQVRKM